MTQFFRFSPEASRFPRFSQFLSHHSALSRWTLRGGKSRVVPFMAMLINFNRSNVGANTSTSRRALILRCEIPTAQNHIWLRSAMHSTLMMHSVYEWATKKKCKIFIIFIAHAKGKWEMSPAVVGCVSTRPKKVYRGAIAKIHFPFCIFSSRVFRFIARRQRNEHLSKHKLRELVAAIVDCDFPPRLTVPRVS